MDGKTMEVINCCDLRISLVSTEKPNTEVTTFSENFSTTWDWAF